MHSWNKEKCKETKTVKLFGQLTETLRQSLALLKTPGNYWYLWQPRQLKKSPSLSLSLCSSICWSCWGSQVDFPYSLTICLDFTTTVINVKRAVHHQRSPRDKASLWKRIMETTLRAPQFRNQQCGSAACRLPFFPSSSACVVGTPNRTEKMLENLKEVLLHVLQTLTGWEGGQQANTKISCWNNVNTYFLTDLLFNKVIQILSFLGFLSTSTKQGVSGPYVCESCFCIDMRAELNLIMWNWGDGCWWVLEIGAFHSASN